MKSRFEVVSVIIISITNFHNPLFYIYYGNVLNAILASPRKTRKALNITRGALCTFFLIEIQNMYMRIFSQLCCPRPHCSLLRFRKQAHMMMVHTFSMKREKMYTEISVYVLGNNVEDTEQSISIEKLGKQLRFKRRKLFKWWDRKRWVETRPSR